MDSDTISKLIRYNPKTGVFLRVKRRKRKKRKPLGCIKPNGYRVIGLKGKRHRASHLAWLWMKGEWPLHSIRHLNGDKGDDRWRNLKLINGHIETDILFRPIRRRGPEVRSKDELALQGLARDFRPSSAQRSIQDELSKLGLL